MKDKFFNFWTDSFLNTFCACFLIILLSAVIGDFIYPKNESSVFDGDYPVFYSAGFIARFFKSDLYSLEEQIRYQKEFWPEAADGFHVFAYPPFFAIFFIPFTYFLPIASKIIFIIFSVFITVLSSLKLMKYVRFNFSMFHLFTFILFFSPFTIGFLGGQNNAISFLLLLYALHFYENKKTIFLALTLSLFNFKPQYSLIAFPLFFLFENRKLYFLFFYLFFSLIIFSLSVIYFGIDIYYEWIILMKQLGGMNASNLGNLSRMTSLLSSYQLSLANNSTFFTLILIVVINLVLFLLLFEIFKICRVRSIPVTIICPAIVFLSPQTGFYDSVLLLPFLFSNFKIRNKSIAVWIILFISALILISFKIQFNYEIPALTILLMSISSISLTRIIHEPSPHYS